MQPVPGNVRPRPSGDVNKISVDFDKIGNIDKKKTNVYKMAINERASLKFALKGVHASKVELYADGVLLSVIVPTYDDDWTPDDKTPINFFGDKNFHRGLIDVPAEVWVTTDDEAMPSIMVGIVTPSLSWANIMSDTYEEDVTVGSASGEKKLRIIYHTSGCGFIA
jgi:hypothetical protein